MRVEQVLFDASEALRWPVLALAIVGLLIVLADAGALAMELWRRRDRAVERTEELLAATQLALQRGEVDLALSVIGGVARTPKMAAVLHSIVLQVSLPNADERIAKRLADYEYAQIRRLERTRILVRFGPALGLMGTLIPLSPALAGLAQGDVQELTDNLQVAFSVTVLGLLVGAVAFAISLVRDRLYGHDFSDVQYVAAMLTAGDSRPLATTATGPVPTVLPGGA